MNKVGLASRELIQYTRESPRMLAPNILHPANLHPATPGHPVGLEIGNRQGSSSSPMANSGIPGLVKALYSRN
jgi:hypothetical protein